MRLSRSSNLAIATSLLALGLVVFLLGTTDATMGKTDLSGEASRLAVNLYFDQMKTTAQISVAVLGGAWLSLVINQSEAAEWKSSRGLPWFVAFNWSIVLSLAVYIYGSGFVIRRMFHHQSFDIDAPIVNVVTNVQNGLFALGVIELVAAIFLWRTKT